MTNYKQLRLHQVDTVLERWRKAELPSRPSDGWIKTIRSALRMSSSVLAERVGVSGSAVRKMEVAEASDAITLGSLRRAASALDCELQYALVPRQSLEEKLEVRAYDVARERIEAVAASMVLEDQVVSPRITEAQIDELAKSLLSKGGRGIW
jgi:predicted DNA-binding mobile mystery protein A